MVPQPGAKKVLVVDDDPDLRSAVAEFLNMQGFEVAEADNGLEALLKVKRLRPHGVVLDIMMPRLGGLQALQRIHAFDPAITVVVMSGVADADLQRQAALAGASACLMKPVALSDIAAALRGQVPPAREENPSVRPGPAAGRVLVVDDEREIRETLQEFLAAKGYDVREATNGAAGIAAVAEAHPDVVLLDIQMPGLGGVDALAAIRAIAPQVKVIMVSGTPDADVASRALAYGAFDFVAKPIDLAYLERSLETAMSMKELERG